MDFEIAAKTIHIGRNIEKIRKLRGMTQDAVGKGLNITKQAVSLLEQSDIRGT
jgi:transcriptional regulator with XRE-family HTH domain